MALFRDPRAEGLGLHRLQRDRRALLSSFNDNFRQRRDVQQVRERLERQVVTDRPRDVLSNVLVNEQAFIVHPLLADAGSPYWKTVDLLDSSTDEPLGKIRFLVWRFYEGTVMLRKKVTPATQPTPVVVEPAKPKKKNKEEVWFITALPPRTLISAPHGRRGKWEDWTTLLSDTIHSRQLSPGELNSLSTLHTKAEGDESLSLEIGFVEGAADEGTLDYTPPPLKKPRTKRQEQAQKEKETTTPDNFPYRIVVGAHPNLTPQVLQSSLPTGVRFRRISPSESRLLVGWTPSTTAPGAQIVPAAWFDGVSANDDDDEKDTADCVPYVLEKDVDLVDLANASNLHVLMNRRYGFLSSERQRRILQIVTGYGLDAVPNDTWRDPQSGRIRGPLFFSYLPESSDLSGVPAFVSTSSSSTVAAEDVDATEPARPRKRPVPGAYKERRTRDSDESDDDDDDGDDDEFLGDSDEDGGGGGGGGEKTGGKGKGKGKGKAPPRSPSPPPSPPLAATPATPARKKRKKVKRVAPKSGVRLPSNLITDEQARDKRLRFYTKKPANRLLFLTEAYYDQTAALKNETLLNELTNVLCPRLRDQLGVDGWLIDHRQQTADGQYPFPQQMMLCFPDDVIAPLQTATCQSLRAAMAPPTKATGSERKSDADKDSAARTRPWQPKPPGQYRLNDLVRFVGPAASLTECPLNRPCLEPRPTELVFGRVARVDRAHLLVREAGPMQRVFLINKLHPTLKTTSVAVMQTHLDELNPPSSAAKTAATSAATSRNDDDD